jgi:acetylornithine deacetylase/succinyl-diaminopimelate desuccinylase-like protein
MVLMPKADLDVKRATAEATAFLQRLLQFDTTNPPGNETACARYIADIFEQEGIKSEVVEPAPGRGSIIARLQGSGARRPLLLLSHLDVVPAVAADWKRPPFGGEIAGGEIWGRGALDTKNLTAIWMAVMLEIKRKSLPLARDVIFAATADEEMGGVWGVKWLVDNRPELIDAEYALNEGGGSAVSLGGQTLFVYQTAEKGICWTGVTARGTAGHASTPHSDNPVVRLAGVLHKIGTSRLPIHVTDTLRLFVERMAAALPPEMGPTMRALLDPDQAEAALAILPDGHQANTVRAMSRNTACPTVMRGSDKTNVIPQIATAQIDCRILPGQTPESLLGELREIMGPEGKAGGKIELSLDRSALATESPPDTPLSEALEKAIERHSPGARVVPFLVPGGTDGRFLRPRGVVCYGFCPTLPGADEGSVHGINERVSIETMDFGVRVLWEAVTEMVLP